MHNIFTVLIIVLIVGLSFIWLINRAFRRKKMRLHQAIRDNGHAERDKQLQDAKDKGDFDKWNHDH